MNQDLNHSSNKRVAVQPNEKWDIWEPVQGLSTRYKSGILCDKVHELILVLRPYSGDDRSVVLTFEHAVNAYACTEQSLKVRAMQEYIEQGTLSEWAFYRVSDSPYVQWIVKESCAISEQFPLKHFVCVAGTTLFDIVATYEPAAEFVDVAY